MNTALAAQFHLILCVCADDPPFGRTRGYGIQILIRGAEREHKNDRVRSDALADTAESNVTWWINIACSFFFVSRHLAFTFAVIQGFKKS